VIKRYIIPALFTMMVVLTGCSTVADKDVSANASAASGGSIATAAEKIAAPQESRGLQIGAQAYTFRNFTLFETIDKSAALGLTSIELFPGQKIGGDVEGVLDVKMSAAARAAVAAKLLAAGIKVRAFGCITPQAEADWVEVFTFCKTMGIPTICSEPSPEQLDTVEKLADQFQVNVAFHNHATPSQYWNPQTVVDACKNRSKRLGACADTGHWARSGLDPVASLKLLEGRLIVIHIKDVNVAEQSGECVIFGKGVCKFPAMIAELKRQNFSGMISIEYESSPANPYPDVLACVDYLNKCLALSADDLLAGKAPAPGMVDDVAQVWSRLDPTNSGRWDPPVQQTVDTSAYKDATDDAKGTITASGDGFPGEGPANCFDNNTDTKWCVEQTQVWIQYAFADGAKKKVVAYTVTTANDESSRDPHDWKLLGSNDGQNWTTLDEQDEQHWEIRFEKRLYKIKTPGEFSIYKLDVTGNNDNETTTQMSEIELLVSK